MKNSICAFSTSDDSYAVKSALSLLTVRKWRPELALFLIGRRYSEKTKAFLRKHNITAIEIDLDDKFHTSWDYPVECYYLFAGPELLKNEGFDYSVYVDGDVYCNKDPFLKVPLKNLTDFAGALTQRSIRAILKDHDSGIAAKVYGNEEALESGRIQTGIVYFNNTSLKKKKFLDKITKVYDDAIINGIPRKGDDSLLALFKVAYPKWGYLDIGREYNMIAFKRNFGADWRTTDQEMINNAVFAHFTNHAKPWTNASTFPTYTYSYFYHAWRRHAIDTLSDDDLKQYFPAIKATLSSKHLRFYWYPTKNVGDLITPYFLEKACDIKDLSTYSISEKEIKTVERNQVDKNLPLRLSRFASKLSKRRFKVPHKQAQYGVSTGSVVRLCQDHAMVYGSGVRSHDQKVHHSFIRAVRGPLTRKRYLDSGYPCPPVYGDPGLLLPKYYFPKVKKRYNVGIIPHFTEYDQISKQYENDEEVSVIDMGCGDLEKVIDQMLACTMTLSSSLHGLILSHAYGLPTRQVEYSNNINGDGTKFTDYYSSIPIKRISAVQATEYKYLSPTKLKKLKYEQPMYIDTSKLENAMFFDENGMRKSAYYPYA